jgi:hypothetical protein
LFNGTSNYIFYIKALFRVRISQVRILEGVRKKNNEIVKLHKYSVFLGSLYVPCFCMLF